MAYQDTDAFAICHSIQSIAATHNNAPEPTPIVAVSSAVAVRVVDAAWLSFIR